MKIILASFFALVSALNISLGLANPEMGEIAPGFHLQDQNNQWHELEDYRGKWLVLYFYPKADTPGCTTEACEFRDNIFAFEDIGAAIIGVSVDDVISQKESSDKYHLPFPLLSDAKQEVAESYGVLTTFFGRTLASRQTFLVGPGGHVAKHYEDVDPASHTNQVLADLKTLMALE